MARVDPVGAEASGGRGAQGARGAGACSRLPRETPCRSNVGARLAEEATHPVADQALGHPATVLVALRDPKEGPAGRDQGHRDQDRGLARVA